MPCPTYCPESRSCGLPGALPIVLDAVPAGLPVGTLRPCLTPDRRSPTGGKCRPSFCYLAAGQPVMSCCLDCWFWLSCCLGAALVPVLVVVVVPPCAACRASINRHGRRPSIYREGEPTEGWGNPEGVPRSQTALRRSIFSQVVELSTVWASPTTGNFYRKRTTGTPYRFRGGLIYREKGGLIYREKPSKGGLIYRSGGVRFIVDKLAYPQGFSTGRTCFGHVSGCFLLVTGGAPGRVNLSPMVGGV